MSALARLLHRIPATRRSYSSFGGGRYFNSSKPSKSPVVTAKSNSSSDHPSDRNPKDTSTKASSASPAATAKPGSSNNNPPTPNAKPPPEATSPEPIHEAATPSFRNGTTLSSYTPPNSYHNYLSSHPTVNSKDFKIHQFFSLHRPLLLLSNPPSVFASAPANAPLFPPSVEKGNAAAAAANNTGDTDELPPSPFTSLNLDGSYATPYGTVDGDAEAARQLHHAMTMHRIGAAVSWDEALKKLGLDVSQDAERVQLREQWEREWEEVMMDSVKRKRKKKMKKHKLKKRRRETRSQRMRIGR